MDTCNGVAAFSSGLSIARHRLVLTVTGYPPEALVQGAEDVALENLVPRLLAGPWHAQVDVGVAGGPAAFNVVDVPLLEHPGQQLRVHLDGIVPAQPGWLAGRMRVEDTYGQVLGTQRPFLLYAHESDIPSHTYFADAPEFAYSVGLRISQEGPQR